jgi:hypothetical protein
MTYLNVRFDVFTAVTMKNGIFWDVIYKYIYIYKNVNKWFKSNHLALNINKTHVIHFTGKKCSAVGLNIKIRNNLLTTASCTNFLGLIIN